MTNDVLAMIQARMREAPGAIALADLQGSTTYADLDRLSGSIASYLEARKVAVGEPVGVHAPLSRWAIAGMLGVLRAGARYVPIDMAFPVDRQQQMKLHSGARIHLTQDLIAALPEREAPWRDGPHAYTIFTSGSTGNPKAVSVSRAALSYSTTARIDYYREPPRRFLLCSSISFDSSVAGIYWTLCTGSALIIPSDRPANLPAILKAGREYHPTHALMVPSLYRLLLRSPIESLTTVIVAGETCPPELVRQHFNIVPRTDLYNEYGPTECTVWSTVHKCTPGEDPVPIGRPIPGTAVSIQDGELVISSPGVVNEQREYRTGDIVSLGDDGLLRYHGRADNQLKLGGMRIESAEIESALLTIPGIADAAIGVHESRVAAFLTGLPSIDERELRAHLLQHLPAVAVPRAFRLVARLPVLPNGKLDRNELANRAEEIFGGVPSR
ncbi:amino acid adenylation domain-containing protein [Micromonospora sp. NBC_01638]|uniref:amino acid adenylation domain-containing protein n=1 Tax=Micromonospora sp. NBC_01638 TaxID=2975982 RepID=UPI00386912E9|nr:amino acid adenylation domain-containing protein [Micromonospora sp. NBC_01638]